MSAYRTLGFAGWTLLVGLVLGSVGALPAVAQQESEYFSPLDIFAMVWRSPTFYRVSPTTELIDFTVEDFPNLMWPESPSNLTLPWIIRSPDGSSGLRDYPLAVGCIQSLIKAEPLLVDQQCDEAIEIFTEVLQRYPSCYVAHSLIADCHEFYGRHKKASGWYDKALAVNPNDSRSFLNKANNLLARNKNVKARHQYAHALALRPRNRDVLDAVRSNADGIGVELQDLTFWPRAYARMEGERVVVYTENDKPYWQVYGLCKGIWLAEPEHRRNQTGSRQHSWTTLEERQCLLAMLDSYYVSMKDGLVAGDPEIDRLLGIANDGMLDEFIIYEIGSRVSPNIVLMLSEQVRERMVDYVSIHVLQSESSSCDYHPSADDPGA